MKSIRVADVLHQLARARLRKAICHRQESRTRCPPSARASGWEEPTVAVVAVVRMRVARCWVQTSHRRSSDQFAQARQKSCRSLSKSRIESPLEMQGVTAVMLDEARRRKKRLAKKTQSDSDDMLDISESQWISLGRFGSRFSRLFRMMGVRRKGRMRLAWDDGEGAGISFVGAQKGKYTKELVSIAGGGDPLGGR